MMLTEESAFAGIQSNPDSNISEGDDTLELYADVFAGNLSRLMVNQGISNARLARLLVPERSREAIGQWRRGAIPSYDTIMMLCIILKCKLSDFQTPLTTLAEPMLPLTAWARREGIPVQRARDLFALRLMTGERNTPYTTLIPATLQAPADSKQLVQMAKCRPRWVPIFHENFARLVKEQQTSHTDIAGRVGVTYDAVSHWMKRRNYPKESRLPLIARALGVPIHELIGDMPL
jgi:transcriptional regulator with XRE-family HTH domain